jgi:hypothetical protein
MQHQIYVSNIQMKHMQHTSKMYETYGCSMCSSTCYRPMKLVDVGMGERSARRERRAARVTDGAWGEARGVRGLSLSLSLKTDYVMMT